LLSYTGVRRTLNPPLIEITGEAQQEENGLQNKGDDMGEGEGAL